MRRGYGVFRALSPSCPCDLIVLSGNAMVRVEVKTGTRAANGRIACGYTVKDRGRSDVLAIAVRKEDAIEYLPPIEQALALAVTFHDQRVAGKVEA